MSGIALSIVFQYYREKPLWIPIRWNSLFLIINITMILLLLKESNDAEHIPDEQKDIYETIFQPHGMNMVDFLHLMAISQRREVNKGEKLVSLGLNHHHLHFVKQGRLSVKRSQEVLPEIHEHQFVGAMSFMDWEGECLLPMYLHSFISSFYCLNNTAATCLSLVANIIPFVI